MEKAIRFLRDNNIILITIISSLIIFLFNPRFLSIDNVSAISRQIVPIGFLVIGQFFVIVSGNIDLSMGMSAVLFANVLGVFFGLTGDVTLGVVCVIICSLLLGFLNGFFVSRIGIPAFIVTLSTLFIATGLSGLIIPRGKQIFLTHKFFKFLGAAKLFGIYYALIFMIILFLCAYFFFNHTKYGMYIIAIGDNEENAKLVGIDVKVLKTVIFMISGLCSGFAGMIISSRISFVLPGLDGTSIMMDAITAIIIGGTLIQGGKGTIGGSLWGLLFIGILNNSLNLLNVEDVLHLVFKGIVIIAALALNWALRNTSHIEAH